MLIFGLLSSYKKVYVCLLRADVCRHSSVVLRKPPYYLVGFVINAAGAALIIGL